MQLGSNSHRPSPLELHSQPPLPPVLATGFQRRAAAGGVQWWGGAIRQSRFQVAKAQPELSAVTETWFFLSFWRRRDVRV